MTWGDMDRLRAQVTRTAEQVTQRRFCTSCQTTQPFEGGRARPMANGRMRWSCRTCAARTLPGAQ